MPDAYLYYLNNIIQIFTSKKFKGWGRKKTGRFALWCHNKFDGVFILLEDGFIRSVDLGVNNSPSFSLVEDNIGIYYDAQKSSKLENILNTYNFSNDNKLMKNASLAVSLIRKHHISKYNNSPNISNDYFNSSKDSKILIIAQTAGDSSLKYGMLEKYSTEDMIDAALSENPNSIIYLKIHPDVLSGKKKSDIDIESAKKKCIIIEDNVNPISLLKHFSKVYTKTSQMGFEALLVGCECVCFGMPFYAGWGITDDRSVCKRRTKILSIEEVFAGAYILYTTYYNPYKNKPSDIIDTIQEIIFQKNNSLENNLSNSPSTK